MLIYKIICRNPSRWSIDSNNLNIINNYTWNIEISKLIFSDTLTRFGSGLRTTSFPTRIHTHQDFFTPSVAGHSCVIGKRQRGHLIVAKPVFSQTHVIILVRYNMILSEIRQISSTEKVIGKSQRKHVGKVKLVLKVLTDLPKKYKY